MTRSGMHYHVSNGDGPAVVFIHGVTMDLTMWDAQVAEFGDAWRCITLDIRGHGRSAQLEPGYESDADLLEVLDDTAVGTCMLVGLSLGGYEAISFASRHPERCAALMLVDAWIPGPELGGWAPPFKVARESGRQAALEAWLDYPLFQVSRRQPATWAALQAMVRQNDLRIWTERIPRRPAPQPRELAPGITVPTRVLAGEHELPGFRAVADWLAATIPGAAGGPLTVVPGAGHLPPMETPAAFNRELAAFVEA
ncbi:MAG: alpha/beta fold hydrolase [Candidatus Dormibacteraeota bacterium]|uniref:Alpha/beta fold hydrolase n=1 Tax=Candidatus Dormiibacter inghamiae TaxID=3127013 RepID=A0A934KE54_9BACT|nr:alpha/beta fold hydrolase [Candidatus Dormibacteraeota bacterium]